ncbi:MAG: 3-methyl-2-oxobutanoate dehydrogenase subunit VorB [Proteobacteria bacterium]|nr:3-methyl-2-oxobutanoate dehydrogenase subunit VorB [Pseudomonadota bacterium]NIS71689.1 3-methyl-2-oxobutanoate dehydrogenase subunit VorB [Pseudomonadota bacterium]
MGRLLMRGNHVIGEAAIRAGCHFYAGYPITPQNELTEYMAARLSEVKDGVFIQAESELAAINMVMGASMAGTRAMTSSSGPGISLKQESISFLSAMELPAVIVNISRGGPGLGNIAPSQSDYFQATRGGGHGDYRNIVLAPNSVQELADLTMRAFDLADKYRTPVLILGDGMLGQMMEPVEFLDPKKPGKPVSKEWTLTGANGRPSRIIRSLLLDPTVEEEHNWKLVRKYERIIHKETLVEDFLLGDSTMAVIAFGTAARITKGAILRAREQNIKVGMIRPITLWPFPSKAIQEISKIIKHFLVFELNTGQMIDDVRLSLEGRGEVHFYGRPGGIIPTPLEVSRVIASQYYQKRLG